MKRPRLVFTVAALVFLLGIVTFVLNVVKAKPIPLINPTEINNFREAGSLVLERLREEVRTTPIFVLGSHPFIMEGESVWDGFLSRAAADKMLKPALVAAHNGVPNLSPAFGGERKIFYWPEDQTKLAEWAKAFVPAVFLTTSFQSHPREDGTLASAFPNDPNVIYITEAPLYLTEEQLKATGQKCEYRSTAPANLIFCASEQASLKFQRKKLDPNKHWIVMERHGLRNIMVFLY